MNVSEGKKPHIKIQCLDELYKGAYQTARMCLWNSQGLIILIKKTVKSNNTIKTWRYAKDSSTIRFKIQNWRVWNCKLCII